MKVIFLRVYNVMSMNDPFKINVTFKKQQGGRTLCWIYNYCGEYDKPFLIITDNSSKTPYFESISFEFERKLREIGLGVPMVEWFPTFRSYRLPEEGSWWNDKEQKWYEEEEWMDVLDRIFSEIKEDFDAGKFD